MNGMLIKEFLQFKRKSPINTIYFIVAALVMISIFGIRTNLLLCSLLFFFNTNAVGSILYLDIPTHWNRWCVTAPIPRKDIVISKYVISMIYEFIAFIVSAIGLCIFLYFNNSDPYTEICYAVSVASLLILLDTIKLICIFWKGSYRGGNISFFINLVLVFVLIFTPLIFIRNFIWIFLIFSLVIRISSIPLSVWLYDRRSL